MTEIETQITLPPPPAVEQEETPNFENMTFL